MKKTLAIATFVAAVAMSSVLYGGTVVWDTMWTDHYEYDGCDEYCFMDPDSSAYLDVNVVDIVNETVTIEALAFTALEYSDAFVLARFGDIVCADYFDGISEYFFKAEFDTAEKWGDWRTDYTITVGKKEHTFIGYSTAIFYDPNKFYYGWFELGLDDDNHLFVVHSAYDIDGDPIVVGMLPAVPEPKSLQLAGLAVCALVVLKVRRLRRAMSCVFEKENEK